MEIFYSKKFYRWNDDKHLGIQFDDIEQNNAQHKDIQHNHTHNNNTSHFSSGVKWETLS